MDHKSRGTSCVHTARRNRLPCRNCLSWTVKLLNQNLTCRATESNEGHSRWTDFNIHEGQTDKLSRLECGTCPKLYPVMLRWLKLTTVQKYAKRCCHKTTWAFILMTHTTYWSLMLRWACVITARRLDYCTQEAVLSQIAAKCSLLTVVLVNLWAICMTVQTAQIALEGVVVQRSLNH